MADLRILGPALAAALGLAACDAADRTPGAALAEPQAAAMANDTAADPSDASWAGPAAIPAVASDPQAVAFPKLTGRVVDEADLFSPEVEARLIRLSGELERRTTDQLVIVAVRSLGGRPIADYARALGNDWRIGQAGKDNGVLLLVAPNEQWVRIAVGYGLEPILTNARAAAIIERDLLPAFRENRFEDGVAAGAAAIVRILIEQAGVPRRGRS